MGLSILAFACSIDAFRAVYGCRDDALYEKLVLSQDTSVRHYLSLNDPDPEASVEQIDALRGIIAGDPLKQFRASTYARSLIAVLHGLGRYLGSNGGSYGRQNAADAVLYKMGEKIDALPDLEVRWPIGELQVEDWPMICTISADRVIRYAAIMKDIMTRVTEEKMGNATPSAYYFLLELTEYYQQCADEKQDLILVAF